jgi:prefoldin subunit 5
MDDSIPVSSVNTQLHQVADASKKSLEIRNYDAEVAMLRKKLSTVANPSHSPSNSPDTIPNLKADMNATVSSASNSRYAKGDVGILLAKNVDLDLKLQKSVVQIKSLETSAEKMNSEIAALRMERSSHRGSITTLGQALIEEKTFNERMIAENESLRRIHSQVTLLLTSLSVQEQLRQWLRNWGESG